MTQADAIRHHLLRMADKHIAQPELNAAVRHLLGLGKLYRPRLALSAFTALTDRAPDDVQMLAVTPLELIHTFTLIHDDLPCMDDAALRRGVAAVHVEYGEAMAVLSGDALCDLAFQVLTDEELELDAATRLKLVKSLARSTQQVVEGQVLDLAAENQDLDERQVLDIQYKKTGALLGACCEYGAILAGASEHQQILLCGLGTTLGSLFQMRDDLLAAESDETQTGKTHTDAHLGKRTLVSILGMEAARSRAMELEQRVLEMLASAELGQPEILVGVIREAYHRDR